MLVFVASLFIINAFAAGDLVEGAVDGSADASTTAACAVDGDCEEGSYCYRAGQPEASCVLNGLVGAEAPEDLKAKSFSIEALRISHVSSL